MQNSTLPAKMVDRRPRWSMAAAGSSQPNRPQAPRPAANKPLQVMQINRRDEQDQLQKEAAEERALLYEDF